MIIFLNKIYNLIGLAQRAGKISSGTDIVSRNLSSGRGILLIVAADASTEVKKKLLYICEKRKITSIILGDKITLGQCIGKGQRVALTINDRGFAQAIIKEVRQSNDGLDIVEVVEWPK